MINKSIMHQTGTFHFHKGHYLSTNVEDSLRQVENENFANIKCEEDDATDYLYTQATIFLRGSCNLFALALNDEFGYTVYEVKDYMGRLTHVFCKSTYHGQDVYIDVRGVTTDISECLSEFSYRLLKGYSIVTYDIEEDRELENEGDETGYQFAQAVVRKYKKYYDSSL